ncbi:MBL fold metallo-hydrolase [Clostridium sp. DJ247]|uniref:MBL fold metallo-hydrolase n=1 Tax=Clostridium sp. DJ247 TaxID=2726188 RepID=UPI0016253CB8|nr:MBL fold metallo-hydrolase [Clostridium sp. DJ247]MBC2580920.1 MBL fold metallo-hydrolase [Clostridium sp. DJ247]
MIFCPLYSGSSGNSIFVSSENTKVLIDAGLPGKSIEQALVHIGQNAKDIDAIFVTHEHTDHTKGVGVLSRKYDIPIYANAPTWQAMAGTVGKIKEHNIKFIDSTYVSIKDLDVSSYKISHDAAEPSGYTLISKNKKACVATDLGVFSNEVEKSLADADVVLLECNHDVQMLKFGPYPYNLKRRILSNVGHLSNDDCGNAIVSITNDKFKRVILGHLSKTNNYPELAYQTVVNILSDSGIKLDKDLRLTMAKRDMPSNYVEF